MTTEEPLFLYDSQFVRLLSFEQAKSLVIVKRHETSRCTHTRCTKCKSDQLDYSLHRHASHQEEDDASLTAYCTCGNSVTWRCLGWADKDWEPESSLPRARDTYMNATYKWEDEFFSSHRPLSWHKVESLLAVVFCQHDQFAPKLGRMHPNSKVSYAVGTNQILLSENGCRPYIVLHEAAHIFVARFYLLHPVAKREAFHGSLWLTTYLHLVCEHLDVSFEWMALSAMSARLKPLPQSEALQLIKATRGFQATS